MLKCLIVFEFCTFVIWHESVNTCPVVHDTVDTIRHHSNENNWQKEGREGGGHFPPIAGK